ncbi:MAG: hypothetical protein NWF07_09590 [Candidatus Bathyarchaeota archaeon]|nr:hypothetical protein [Candidatus Bathyarchaeota archaeon]
MSISSIDETTDVSIAKWMSRLSENSCETYIYIFKAWYAWMQDRSPELVGKSPDDLIEYQKQTDGDNKYEILELVQDYVSGMDGTDSSKKTNYSALRSFFMHNRAELPRDRGFRIRGNRPPVIGKLKPEDIQRIIISSNKTYKAVFLSMFQAGLDQEGFVYWNTHGWPELWEELSEIRYSKVSKRRLIKITLPGRKHNRYKEHFYTFIGRDAIQAILNYLPHRPDREDAIFYNQYDDPISKVALWNYWHKRLQREGYIELGKMKRGRGNRYGYNLHEIRDVRSGIWEKSPATNSICDFTMGHTVDPLGYRENSFRDESWVRREYLKAMPYFNLMSETTAFGLVGEERVESLEARIEELERERDGAQWHTDYVLRRLEEAGVPIEPQDSVSLMRQLKLDTSDELMEYFLLRAQGNMDQAKIKWEAIVSNSKEILKIMNENFSV